MSTLYNLEAALSAEGRVDRENGVIKGVSVITGDLIALGHNLHVDSVCVGQMHDEACGMKQVPVKLNHGSGADAVVGYLENFRVEGNQLRGDLHLLKFHDKFDHLLEMAERMPTGIGLSAAFRGTPETVGDKTYARVKKLVSVDWVANPAANVNGLFEAKEVDSDNEDMDKPTELTAVLDELKKISEFNAAQADQIAKLEEFQYELLKGFEEASEEVNEEEEVTEEVVADEVSEESSDELTDEEVEAVADLLADVAGEESAEFEAKVDALVEASANEEPSDTEVEFNAKIEELEEALLAFGEILEERDAEIEALKHGAANLGDAPAKSEVATEVVEASSQFESRVQSLMGEKEMNFSDASEKVVNDEPELYREYLKGIGAL